MAISVMWLLMGLTFFHYLPMFLCPQQEPQLFLVLYLMMLIQIFNSDESGPLVVLLELGICYLPFCFTTRTISARRWLSANGCESS